MSIEEKTIDFVNDQVPTVARRYSHTPSIHEHDVGFVWNNDHEKLIKEYATQATNYAILHDRTAKYYNTLNKYMAIPSKIISGAVSFIQFAQLTDTSNATWNFYLSGFLSMVALFFQVLVDYIDYQTLSNKHSMSSIIYDNLSMDIAMELTHPKEQRANVRSFFRKVKQTLTDTKKITPDIPNSVLDSFVKIKVNEEPEKKNE